MNDHSLLARAIAFSAKAHDGQVRKGSNTPYIVHPMEAAVICSTITLDEEVLAAAVLHDVVEDTDATCEDIKREFGARVGALVAGESEDKREDKPAAETWELRKQETLDALSATDDEAALMVCLSDKLSNIRAIERDYNELGDALWSRFNQKDPARHGWYYSSIAKILEPSLGKTDAWREYNARVQAVFGSIQDEH